MHVNWAYEWRCHKKKRLGEHVSTWNWRKIRRISHDITNKFWRQRTCTFLFKSGGKEIMQVHIDFNIQGSIHNFRDWCYHLYSSCSSTMQWWTIVLAYLGSQCTQFLAAGWTFWFLTSFYMELCDFWQLIRSSSKELHQIASDNASFLSGDRSWIYTHEPETKEQSSQWKSEE
jgi:hypothetical protein